VRAADRSASRSPLHAKGVFVRHPGLGLSQDQRAGFSLVIVDTVDLPSNLHQSFRIILLRGDLIVVSGQRHFTRSQWRDLATELEVHAA
jgi:hypothetical protein